MFALNLLGGAVLEGPDGPVSGKSAHRRRLALLAILAVAGGRPVGRERLLGLLWADHPGRRARHLLSESLYVLRKEMGEDAFVAAGDEVGLCGRVVRSDVEDFEEAVGRGELERAARLYRGPFLDGFFVSGAPEFERWAEGERERLAASHTRALEVLAEVCEREGRPRDAAAWWRRLAAQDPFNSRVGMRLMRALDAAGERAAALWFAESHVAFLRDELGVEPEDDFADLVDRLRSEPVSVPAAPPLAASAESGHTPAPPAREGDWAGIRVDEVDREERAGDAAGAAAGGEDRGERAASGAERAVAGGAGEAAADGAADGAGEASAADGGSQDGIAGGAGVGTGRVNGAVVREDHTVGAEVRAESAARGRVREEGAEGGDRENSAADEGDREKGTAKGDDREKSAADGGDQPPSAAPPPPPAIVADVPSSTPAPAAGAPGGGRSRRGRYLPLGAFAAVLAALAGLLLYGQGRAPAAANPPAYDPRRIAVLYFDDDSPRGDLGYLASGLTEMLIHELSQVPALEVITRNGVKPYQQGMVSFDSMRAALHVGSVVAGSVQRAGDSVRVTVQLVDAATQAPLASRVIVRHLDDVAAMETALAREVSAILRRRLGREIRLREAGAGTRDGRALHLVLQAAEAREDASALEAGRDSLDTASEAGLLQRADSLLSMAEQRDPQWDRPTLLRGWTALRRADLARPAGQPALYGAAAGFAERVLVREPQSPEALELRGRVRWRQGLRLGAAPQGARLIDQAERDLRAAVGARPALATAWGTLSQLLLSRGRFGEADLAARRALAADAWLDEAEDIFQQLFFGVLMTGDYAAAGDVCARARQAFPRDPRFVECRLTLLREDAGAAPDAALAWRLVAELDRLDPPEHARAAGRAYAPVYRRMVAASISARAGDHARARSELDRARASTAGDTASGVDLAYDEAYLLLALGDRAAARLRLEAYLAARPAVRPFVARDPLFRGLVSKASPETS